MELTCKPAEQRDVQIIFDLSRDLIDRYEDVASIDYDRVLNWMHRKIRDNIGQYMCVFADGRKAAYYRFCRNGQMMELDDLYVLPEFRSRGIGTKILEKCCAETADPVMLSALHAIPVPCLFIGGWGFKLRKKWGIPDALW